MRVRIVLLQATWADFLARSAGCAKCCGAESLAMVKRSAERDFIWRCLLPKFSGEIVGTCCPKRSGAQQRGFFAIAS